MDTLFQLTFQSTQAHYKLIRKSVGEYAPVHKSTYLFEKLFRELNDGIIEKFELSKTRVTSLHHGLKTILHAKLRCRKRQYRIVKEHHRSRFYCSGDTCTETAVSVKNRCDDGNKLATDSPNQLLVK